jgi:hypothetical protein
MTLSQAMMALIVTFSCIVLALHAYITTRFPSNISPDPELPEIPSLDAKSIRHAASQDGAKASSSGAERLNGTAVAVEADASSRLRASSEASTSGTAPQGASLAACNTVE